MARLEAPVEIGNCQVPNRLYRAPLLECAGNDEDAVDILIDELVPAAESGAGVIFQGATIVRGEGGCAAPGMTRVHDPDFVSRLSRLTDAIHDCGGKIFVQLEHGGLRSMEIWHAGYRTEHPDLEQLVVSRPPRLLRALDRAGFLDLNPRVMTTEEVYELAADFGRAAARATETGYDGIHLAGANMGILQQFLSPYYNRRDDEFGGSPTARARFLELLAEEIRDRAGDVPLVTKVPAETAAPPFVRRRISRNEGVALAERAADAGYDALVPVEVSTFWDMSVIRGEYPAQAWRDERFREGYTEAFGSRWRTRLVTAANRVQALWYSRETAWNESFCRAVRERVDVPVLLEGGVRTREEIERLLGEGVESRAADLVGMGRPFYAEPRLPARLLAAEAGAETAVACEDCNNCTVPQVTGARGICRTPSVLEKRGEYERSGAYAVESRDRESVCSGDRD